MDSMQKRNWIRQRKRKKQQGWNRKRKARDGMDEEHLPVEMKGPEGPDQ
jgi:hypothetical protein